MFMFLFLFFSTLLLCSFFRLKELFQVKNGVKSGCKMVKMPKIGVGRKTVNGEKKEDGPSLNFRLSLCGNNISRLLKLNFKQGPLLKENITQDFLSK